MKQFAALLVALMFASLASTQDVRTAGVPPGAVQAGQASDQAERNLPPPMKRKATVDLVALQQQADELSRLAQTVPLDVASIRKGVLPKDYAQKLKQIEKLSKRLRSQLDL
jgi:hypothetical protein